MVVPVFCFLFFLESLNIEITVNTIGGGGGDSSLLGKVDLCFFPCQFELFCFEFANLCWQTLKRLAKLCVLLNRREDEGDIQAYPESAPVVSGFCSTPDSTDRPSLPRTLVSRLRCVTAWFGSLWVRLSIPPAGDETAGLTFCWCSVGHP